MANQKKFKDPVSFPLRIERDTMIKVEEISPNKNDFFKQAIIEKIERVKRGL